MELRRTYETRCSKCGMEGMFEIDYQSPVNPVHACQRAREILYRMGWTRSLRRGWVCPMCNNPDLALRSRTLSGSIEL